MATRQTSEFPAYMTRLLSEGRTSFSCADARRELGISKSAFLKAAERQQRHKRLLMPRRGFYVITPPQYLAWGAPPPAWYINSLMRHENRPYYVALLKAADLHGVSHQAVMEFQVITDRQFPKITAGRSKIAFYYRKNLDALTTTLPAAIEERKTYAGYMRLASVELTLFDLLRYPRAAGGFDNIATLIRDLSEKINPRKLAKISTAFERPLLQRLGCLLDKLAERQTTQPLHAALSRTRALPWTELQPSLASIDGPGRAPPPLEHDSRWRVIIRRQPHPDT